MGQHRAVRKGKTMINYDEKLKKLGITLDKPSKPAANYIPYTISGNLVFISGQLPFKNGKIPKLARGIYLCYF